jgi:hydroxyethylthiazole kinase-like uncharacterized protein yjeF
MLEGAMKLLTADQMRCMDSYAINTVGIPGIVLMENAGRSVVDTIEEFFEPEWPLKAAVFCGKGNNGGDGFVVARHLEQRGHKTVIYLLARLEELQGDARVNAEIAKAMGLDIREAVDADAVAGLDFDARDFGLVVDAIFGTGLESSVRGHYLSAIDLINGSGLPVVAVDLPSGVNADSGVLMGPAVEADLTVTFAYPKVAHVMPPAERLCGDVVVADISIPPCGEGEDLKTYLLTDDAVAPLIQPRERNSHKGTYGHLLVAAGSMGKSGAAAMIGKSALLAGAGLVTVGVPFSITGIIEMACLETMTVPLSQAEGGVLSFDALESILALLEDKTALAFGSGTGVGEETVKLFHELVKRVGVTMVIDADGVNAFAGKHKKLRSDKAQIIITPHPGEMARLLGTTVDEVQADRIGVARKLAQENGIIVVLKGYRTVVAEPGGAVYVNMSGNPGMATAGSGDVLTGMIAGLAAQRDVSPLEAALIGVFVHGMAGDIAAEALGEVSLTAGDMMEAIPMAFQELTEEEE